MSSPSSQRSGPDGLARRPSIPLRGLEHPSHAQFTSEAFLHSLDQGLPSAYETSCAKFVCNQADYDAANLAVQALGGMGYSQESIVEYCFRRTRGWMIAGGSTEILKNRIAEEVFGRRFDQRAPK